MTDRTAIQLGACFPQRAELVDTRHGSEPPRRSTTRISFRDGPWGKKHPHTVATWGTVDLTVFLA